MTTNITTSRRLTDYGTCNLSIEDPKVKIGFFKKLSHEAKAAANKAVNVVTSYFKKEKTGQESVTL